MSESDKRSGQIEEKHTLSTTESRVKKLQRIVGRNLSRFFSSLGVAFLLIQSGNVSAQSETKPAITVPAPQNPTEPLGTFETMKPSEILSAASEGKILPPPTIVSTETLSSGAILYNLQNAEVPGETEIITYTAELRKYDPTTKVMLSKSFPGATEVYGVWLNNTPERFNSADPNHFRLAIYFDPKDVPEGTSFDEYMAGLTTPFDPKRIQFLLDLSKYQDRMNLVYPGNTAESRRSLTMIFSSDPKAYFALPFNASLDHIYEEIPDKSWASLSGPGSIFGKGINPLTTDFEVFYGTAAHETSHASDPFFNGSIPSMHEHLAQTHGILALLAWGTPEGIDSFYAQIASGSRFNLWARSRNGLYDSGYSAYNPGLIEFAFVEYAEELGLDLTDGFAENGSLKPEILREAWDQFTLGQNYVYQLFPTQEQQSALIEELLGPTLYETTGSSQSDRALEFFIKLSKLRREGSTNYQPIIDELKNKKYPMDTILHTLVTESFANSQEEVIKLFSASMQDEMETYYLTESSMFEEINNTTLLTFVAGAHGKNTSLLTYPTPGYPLFKIYSLRNWQKELHSSEGTHAIRIMPGNAPSLVDVIVRNKDGSITFQLGAEGHELPNPESNDYFILVASSKTGQEKETTVQPFKLTYEEIPPTATPIPTAPPTATSTPLPSTSTPTGGPPDLNTPTSTPTGETTVFLPIVRK